MANFETIGKGLPTTFHFLFSDGDIQTAGLQVSNRRSSPFPISFANTSTVSHPLPTTEMTADIFTKACARFFSCSLPRRPWSHCYFVFFLFSFRSFSFPPVHIGVYWTWCMKTCLSFDVVTSFIRLLFVLWFFGVYTWHMHSLYTAILASPPPPPPFVWPLSLVTTSSSNLCQHH